MGMFQTTQWSLVLAARQEGTHARQAFEELCRLYRPAVLAYVRCRGHEAQEAEDLTQAFFLNLVERRFDADADRAKGRFRTFLLVALQRFLMNTRVSENAAKRGGGRPAGDGPSADEVPDESTVASPERAFELNFALAVMTQVLDGLRKEARAAGREALYDSVKDYVIEPPDEDSYSGIAERLGMKRNTVAVAVHRMRQRARELVRQTLMHPVADEHDLEEELSVLSNSLSRREGIAVQRACPSRRAPRRLPSAVFRSALGGLVRFGFHFRFDVELSELRQVDRRLVLGPALFISHLEPSGRRGDGEEPAAFAHGSRRELQRHRQRPAGNLDLHRHAVRLLLLVLLVHVDAAGDGGHRHHDDRGARRRDDTE